MVGRKRPHPYYHPVMIPLGADDARPCVNVFGQFGPSAIHSTEEMWSEVGYPGPYSDEYRKLTRSRLSKPTDSRQDDCPPIVPYVADARNARDTGEDF